MAPAWRLRLAASGSALLPFVGLWLSHTLEYVRVWGTTGLDTQLRGSVHGYMLPLAAVLACLGAAGGVRCRQLWRELARRLEEARLGIAAAWRSRPPRAVAARADAPPSRSAGVVALFLPVLAVQLALYMLQENAEAWGAGAPAPGLGAVSGIHWAAPLLHIAVALVLSAVVVTLRRHVGGLIEAVAACVRLLRVLAGFLGRPIAHARPRPSWRPSPLDRLGRQLWRRPPPISLSV